MSASVVLKRSRSACERGSVFLEFAISASFFALMLIGSFDLIRLMQTKDALQNGVNRGGRFAVPGSVMPGYPVQDTNGESVRAKIKELAGVELSSFAICPTDNSGNCSKPTPNRGQPNDWIYIKAETEVPLVLNSVRLTVSADTLVRNERNFKFVTVPPPSPLHASIFEAVGY